MRLRKLELQELLPLLLATGGVVGVAPLVVVRAHTGDYLIAAIDAVAVGCFAAVAWAIYKHRAVRPASIAMATFCTICVVAAVHLKGAAMIYWAYPLAVSLFFLLRPIEATSVTFILLASVLPILIEQREQIELTLILLTLVVTVIDSAAFAALTIAQRRQLMEMTLQDPLTGACNRRAMDEAMPNAIATSKSSGEPVSLLMFDIDHFKRVNDEYGHAAGDRVLADVAQCIRLNTRSTDRLFRVGGEEFVVLAASSGAHIAQRLGESLRMAVANTTIESRSGDRKTLNVTISIGVAEWQNAETAEHWFKRADDALYEAKHSGRNRTHLAANVTQLSERVAYAGHSGTAR